MLDLRQIREQPEWVAAQLRRREPSVSLAPLLEADRQHRGALAEEERLRARQNAVGPEIAQRKRAKADASELLAEMTTIKQRIQDLAEERRVAEETVERLLLELPNLPHPTTPDSLDKHDNQPLRHCGTVPALTAPQNHVQLASALGLLDFERGAKVAGAGWPCYRGVGAQLEWALLNFCLDRGRRDGYEQIIPPYTVNAGVLTTAGVLPKFQEQVYHQERDDLYLIPTAEIVLTGLYQDEILDEALLPIKMMACTPCFRREAGSYGAEERGLIRIHQFNKIERYLICRPDESYDLLEQLTAEVEQVMTELELPFRTTLLVTGDIAQQATKTYDVEVWLPGQNAYLEVSSASNCEAYQARRGKIRYRPQGGKAELVHTLNGSCLATSRLYAAILENGQQPDGSVLLPPALRPYLNGQARLTP
ncbi:MAG: serine--tRNA ligase [Fimbriimonadaceae bacterium]|nr:serine--tRNA ligase [Fimbriimonadaceae bacterium]